MAELFPNFGGGTRKLKFDRHYEKPIKFASAEQQRDEDTGEVFPKKGKSPRGSIERTPKDWQNLHDDYDADVAAEKPAKDKATSKRLNWLARESGEGRNWRLSEEEKEHLQNEVGEKPTHEEALKEFLSLFAEGGKYEHLHPKNSGDHPDRPGEKKRASRDLNESMEEDRAPPPDFSKGGTHPWDTKYQRYKGTGGYEEFDKEDTVDDEPDANDKD